MSSPYSSPPSNLRSLRDRLVQTTKREGLVFGRLQQHVAVLVVAQLATRLTDAAGAPLLLVKGGSSLELRRGIGDSRTSKDLDTVARPDVAEVHELLADAGELGWEGFTAGFTPPEEIDAPGMPVKPRRFVAKLSYHGQPFASVPIEVSMVDAGNAERFDSISSDALGARGCAGRGDGAVHDRSVAGRAEAARMHRDSDSAEDQRSRPRPRRPAVA